jgi:S-DNA-T family DNA segregation ATPase FtsK/SpoIIIE
MAKKKNKMSESLFDSLSKESKKGKGSSSGEFDYMESLASSGSFVRNSLAVGMFLSGTLLSFSVFELGGPVGQNFLNLFTSFFGFWGYLSPFVFFFSSWFLYRGILPSLSLPRIFGSIILSVSSLGLASLLLQKGLLEKDTLLGEGLIGRTISQTFTSWFSFYPSFLFFIVLSFAGASLLAPDGMRAKLQEKIQDLWGRFFSSSEESSSSVYTFSFSETLESFKKKFSFGQNFSDFEETEEIPEEDDLRDEILKPKRTRKKTPQEEDLEEEPPKESRKKKDFPSSDEDESFVIKTPQKRQEAPRKESVPIEETLGFTPPPLSLLQKDSGKPAYGDLKANATIIKRTLAEFGITVEMDEVSVGPSVTRYALKPAQGVKLSKIASHRQELAYALEAESIRIEAPIPGKSLVGIEIPNEKKTTVGLASLLQDGGWNDPKPLLLALGKGVSGNTVFGNLAKMPHLLIAGTTGSGKSVMVHAIINSLLFRNSPYDLKFIMVDPKKVELTLYNNIPHLYTPVITNAKVTIRTLNWAVNEMERRYDVLESFAERDIASYHKNIFQKAVAKSKGDENADLPERMPYIVIVIDELADIMMSYPKELESAIVRLAQKSRAVGIHLILSTQRPSVNVITGLIKANIPSRIALKVASQIDSRTIIDTAGAEQLLGQGDLLFTSAENPKQERIQSAFVSDGEVKAVVEYLKKSYRDMLPDAIDIESTPGSSVSVIYGADFEKDSSSGGDSDDDLYEEAKEIVISSQKASTSYLQRRLKIGYSRAARLMDILEERGVIGAGDGSKPREVLVQGGGGSSGNISNEEEF